MSEEHTKCDSFTEVLIEAVSRRGLDKKTHAGADSHPSFESEKSDHATCGVSA